MYCRNVFNPFVFLDVMFSEIEQKAINEKIGRLRKVKEGIWTPKYLADLIARRRVNWISRNLDRMLEKYDGLGLDEIAYRALLFDHMRVNPKHSKMIRVSPTKIETQASNFCPYLEACGQLELDTRSVCKEIGELSIQEFCRVISPNLKFGRNYDNIRPYTDFCEEYFELII